MSTVHLGSVIHQLVERSYAALLKLRAQLPKCSDSDRKKELRKYFKTTRLQFIRLFVLLKWVHELPVAQKASELRTFLEQQERHFVEASERLVWLKHSFLEDAKVPLFDVSTAVEVLGTGTYRRLPTAIETPHEFLGESAPVTTVTDEEKEKAKLQMNSIIQAQLLSVRIPHQLVVSRIEGGVLHLLAKDEFEVGAVLLNGTRNNAPWTIVQLKLFVAPEGSTSCVATPLDYLQLWLTKATDFVGNFQTDQISNLAQEGLARAKQPFVDMYNIIHTFCLSLQLNLLHTQAQTLKRLKVASSISKITFQQEVLVIYYWQNPDAEGVPRATTAKASLALNGAPLAYMKISVERNAVQVVHCPELRVPGTQEHLKILVNPCAVNLEAMLTKARNHLMWSRIAALCDEIKAQVEKSVLKYYLTVSLETIQDYSSTHIVVGMCDHFDSLIGADPHAGRFTFFSSIPGTSDLALELEGKLNDGNVDQSLHVLLIALYRKACAAYLGQLALTQDMKSSWVTNTSWNQDLVDQLNSPAVVSFQYNDSTLKRYHLVVSIFTGAEGITTSVLAPKPALPPELHFFIISVKRDPATQRKTYRNLFQIHTQANEITEFPAISQTTFAGLLQPNTVASMTLPSFLPNAAAVAALVSKPSPSEPSKGSPVAPSPNGTVTTSTTTTPVDDEASSNSRKRKRADGEDEDGGASALPDSKRLKMSTDSRPSPIEGLSSIPSPGDQVASPALSPSVGPVPALTDEDSEDMDAPSPDRMDLENNGEEEEELGAAQVDVARLKSNNASPLRHRQLQFSLIVTACRTKLLKLVLQEGLRALNIKHSRAPPGLLPYHSFNAPSLILSINCEPLMSNQCILTILPNKLLVANLFEAQDDISNPDYLIPEASASRSIEYDKPNRKWVFKYKTLTKDSVNNFMSDVKGLARMIEFARQYFNAISETPSYSKFFQLVSVSASSLVLRYGRSLEATITIAYDPLVGGVALQFSPKPHILSSFITAELNARRDTIILLDALLNTHVGITALQRIESCGLTRSTDFNFVPCDVGYLKILFRPSQPTKGAVSAPNERTSSMDNLCKLVVDVRFVGNGIIALSDDIFRSTVAQVAKGTRKGHPLFQFEKFSEFAATKLAKDPQQHLTSQDAILTPMSVTREATYVHEMYFYQFLTLIFPYLASLSLVYNMLLPADDKPILPAPLPIGPNPPFVAELVFTPEFSLGLQINNIPESPVFVDDDRNALVHMFADKVMTPPYRLQYLHTFQQFLALPPLAIKDILRIYRFEQNTRSKLQPELLIGNLPKQLVWKGQPVVKAINHDLTDGELGISVSVQRKGSEAPGLIFGIGLNYKQTPNRVFLWSATGSKEEAVFTQSGAASQTTCADAMDRVLRVLESNESWFEHR